MKLHTILIIILMLNLIGMSQTRTAYVNGKIYTGSSFTETVITEEDKIIFTGSRADAEKYLSDDITIFDLKGKLMLPGFIDAHTHFFNGGFYLTGIDLRPAQSEKEFTSILKQYIDAHPGKWITGGYWDHEKWESKQYPVKELIDEVAPNTPVFVDRIDGHIAVANSYALKAAGITRDTPDPDGGKIEKDPVTGEPTGILKDNAMDLVQRVIPPPSKDDYLESAEASLAHLRENGITGIHDITELKDYLLLKDIEKKGELTCRIYSRLPVKIYKKAAEINNSGDHSKLLRTGSLKAFADGSLGASTAWFFEPYEKDKSNTGLPNDIILSGELDNWALDADKNKLQLCTHAIGDKANNYMLNLYNKIAEINPMRDRRFRIEHAQHVRFEDVPLFNKNNIIASVQPYHAIDDGVWAENRVGANRIHYTHPYREFINNNVIVCFGTDWPIAPLNPLLGIYAAVTRRTVDGKNPSGWIPEQKISVEEAVKCYTFNSAYAGFSEDYTGSIEPGKAADMVLLSEDIFTIDPVNIKDVKVDMTVFNGKIVFTRE